MTYLALSVVVFAIGVLVGAWLRGLIQTDSGRPADAVPDVPHEQPPTSSPPVSHLVDLCASPSGPVLKTIRVSRRPHRLFYGDVAWDHMTTDSAGRWRYEPSTPLTARQRLVVSRAGAAH